MIHKAQEVSKEELEGSLTNYNYQPELTVKLGAIAGPFDQATIQEIVLWKVNRYPSLSSETIALLNQLTSLKQGEHSQGQTVLELLLAKESKGIDLPMASTILRFRNPEVFQIIDRRAYRVLMSDEDKYPIYTTTSIAIKTKLYFEYLDEMLKFCSDKNIPFSQADKILYQLDKNINKDARLDGKQKIKNSKPREGWEEQFRQMHQNGDDKMTDPDVLANEL